MKEKLRDVMMSLGMKEGFDVGLEMSGNASAFLIWLIAWSMVGK